jgi:hypothetical protein
MVAIHSAKELASLFPAKEKSLVPEEVPYEDQVLHIDGVIGFSTKTEYPDDCLFQPGVTPDGKNDDVILIHVMLIDDPKRSDPSKQWITARVVTLQKYINGHFDYDFSDPNCPTKESLESRKQSETPLDIYSNDEFYYDIGSSRFRKADGELIEPREILDALVELHLSPTYRWRGFLIRRARRFHNRRIRGLDWAEAIITQMLIRVFGRKLTEDSNFAYLKGYKRMVSTSAETLEILGFKASKPVIVLFSGLSLSAYLAGKFFHRAHVLKEIGNSNLYSITFAVIGLYLLDNAVPATLFWSLNRVISIRTSLLLRKVDIRRLRPGIFYQFKVKKEKSG